MQIKNLSAAQVQPFGEILSAESELLPPCAERWQIRPGADVRELRADGPVVLDYVSGMPLLVIYGIFRMPVVLAVALTLDCVVLAAFVLLIGTNLYYERRM